MTIFCGSKSVKKKMVQWLFFKNIDIFERELSLDDSPFALRFTY